jgi:hypothetical protein
MINHPLVDKALTPHWLTNLIPGVNVTQTVAKAARDLVNAINDEDPKAMASAVAGVPGPLGTAGRTAKVAMGTYDKVKKDGPSVLSKIQSYNPFRSRSGPPAPIEDRKVKLAATMEELNRIKKLADLTDEDISFNGVTQHDNGDMTYRQGPLSMRKNKDGSSDATATIGDTTARVQQSPIGIKTMTAQGSAADSIVGVDASAERTGVDPKKFAAFQKQNPAVKESLELTDMLRIAGLR